MPKSKHPRKSRKKNKKKSKKGKEVWVVRTLPDRLEREDEYDGEDDEEEEYDVEETGPLPFGVMLMALEDEAAAKLAYRPEQRRHPEFDPATPAAREIVDRALQEIRPGQQASIGIVPDGVCVSAVFAAEEEAEDWLDELSDRLETDLSGNQFVQKLELESQDGPEHPGIDGYPEVPAQIDAEAWIGGLIVSKMAGAAEYEEMWLEDELEKSSLLRAAVRQSGGGERLDKWTEERP